nr:hypothetical protein [Aurantiacibacter sp. MUD61]
MEVERFSAQRASGKVGYHDFDMVVFWRGKRRDQIDQPDFVTRLPVFHGEDLVLCKNTLLKLRASFLIAICPKRSAHRLIAITENPQLLLQQRGHRDGFEDEQRQLAMNFRLGEEPRNLAEQMADGGGFWLADWFSPV